MGKRMLVTTLVKPFKRLRWTCVLGDDKQLGVPIAVQRLSAEHEWLVLTYLVNVLPRRMAITSDETR